MKTVSKIIQVLVTAFALLATLFVVAMVLIVVLDVFLRVVFLSPIVGATEITQMLLVGIILSVGVGILENDNIVVDVLFNKLPEKAQCIMGIVTSVITIAFCALIAWGAIDSLAFSIKFNITYSLLRIPQYPFIIVLAVGFIVACLAICVVIGRHVKKFKELSEADVKEESK